MSEMVIMPKSDYVKTCDELRLKSGNTALIKSEEVQPQISNLCAKLPKDVNFYDWDGTLLYAYTLDELKALEALPQPPEPEEGMISYGWNFSPYEIRDLDRPMEIGNMCGWAYKGIKMTARVPGGMLVKVGVGVKGTAYVDWNDGSEVSTITGNSNSFAVFAEHTYEKYGVYDITIGPASGTDLSTFELGIVGNSYGSHLFCYTQATQLLSNNEIRFNMVDTVLIGQNVTLIDNPGFAYMGMEKVAIPQTVTNIGNSAFYNCENLRYVTIPNSVTEIGDKFFENCKSLKNVSIPGTITSTGIIPFNTCFSLERLTIPDSVTAMESSIASGNFGVRKFFIPEELVGNANVSKVMDGSGSFGNLSDLIIECNEANFSASILGSGNVNVSRVKFTGSILDMGSSVFMSATPYCTYFDFSEVTNVPSLSANIFHTSSSNPEMKIVVPESLYEEWIATGNWANYSDVITAL